MQRALAAAFSAIFLILTTGQAPAEEVKIVGTWSGDIVLLLESKGKIVEAPRQWKLVIEERNASLIRGYHQWKATTDDPGNVDGKNVLGAAEPFIGAISSDGSMLRLVETDDFGILFVEVVEDGRLEATYMESHPNAVVFTSILRRETE